MNFELSDEDRRIQEWAKKLASDLIAPVAGEHTRSKISNSTLKKLCDQGLQALLVPEALGGMGLTVVQFSLVIREISKVCGSVGVTFAVTNMIAEVLKREGTAEQHERFLRQIVDGRSLTASFCLTENQAGSDASGLRTRAEKKGSKYILSGEKIYVTNGAFSNLFLVMARTSDDKKGITAFIVPRDSKGLKVGGEEDKMGLVGSSTVRMSFENVEVDASQRVGAEGEGLKVALRALDGGRISVASQALGIATAAFDAGVKYSKEREAFGKPLADFQAIQWKFADASTILSAAEALILRAAWMKDQGLAFTTEASQAKVFATESAIKVCDDMIQVFGGYGYIKEYPVERYYRDVRVTSLYEGTSEIQRLVIARGLLQ